MPTLFYTFHAFVYFSILVYNLPYHTIPYHTIPYHTIPYHTIPYHTIPYHTILYYTILHYTLRYYTILWFVNKHPRRNISAAALTPFRKGSSRASYSSSSCLGPRQFWFMTLSLSLSRSSIVANIYEHIHMYALYRYIRIYVGIHTSVSAVRACDGGFLLRFRNSGSLAEDVPAIRSPYPNKMCPPQKNPNQ